jgi:hypothetical protein
MVAVGLCYATEGVNRQEKVLGNNIDAHEPANANTDTN